MGRKCVKVAVESLDVDPLVGYRLRTVDKHRYTVTVCLGNHFSDGIYRAEHIAHMCDSHHCRVAVEHTTFAELPFKFEAGTPDFIDIAAFKSAIDYLQPIGMDAIAAHEHELLEYTTSRLLEIPGMRIFGTAPDKDAIISFLIGDAHHYDTGMLLDKLGIAVRTGHHCAEPLMHRLGIEGTVRASFGLYNTIEECDTFIAAVKRVAMMLA